MLTAFGDVEKFLENDDLPPATSTKLLQVLDDPAKTRKLKIEMATTVDTMEPSILRRNSQFCGEDLLGNFFSCH